MEERLEFFFKELGIPTEVIDEMNQKVVYSNLNISKQ